MITTNLSSQARRSLAAFQVVSDQIDMVQNRISTGRKVNSAFDDPTAFFASSNLLARANSLTQLSDNVSSVKKAVDAANNGVQAITSLLNTAQTIVNSALQQTASTLVKVTGNNSSALATNSVIATTGGSGTRLKAGDTITVSDGTTTATYTAANNDTVQTFLNAVNGTANLKVSASLNSNGQIALAASGTNNVTIGGTLTGAGTLNGVTGLTSGTTSFAANTLRSTYSTQFDAIRAQIDAAIADASFSGINLLTSSSKTVFLNETGSSTITLSGANLSSTSLGLAASTNSFQMDADLSTAQANITAALSSLQSQTAALSGSSSIIDARMAFNKSLVETLKSGSDDLVLSDATADSALLMALQTRQQLAATALTMSNGADKLLLRMLGVG